jgi:hypothetical protein
MKKMQRSRSGSLRNRNQTQQLQHRMMANQMMMAAAIVMQKSSSSEQRV